MNERGEATMLTIGLIFAFSSFFILFVFEAYIQYKLLDKRAKVMICAKKARIIGERYIKRIQVSNWGIKNIKKIQYISFLIPGLTAIAGSGEKAKSLLKKYQDLQLFNLKTQMIKIRKDGCHIQTFENDTPFITSGLRHVRDHQEITKTRHISWPITISLSPFSINLVFQRIETTNLKPQIQYSSKENLVKFLSIWQYSF